MTGSGPRASWRLRSLLLAVYLAGGVAVAISLWSATRSAPDPAALLVCLLLLLATERTGFNVALGAAKILVDWLEAVLVLGLILIPAPWLVLATAVVLSGSEIARKSKLMQGSFNVAKTTGSVALAG